MNTIVKSASLCIGIPSNWICNICKTEYKTKQKPQQCHAKCIMTKDKLETVLSEHLDRARMHNDFESVVDDFLNTFYDKIPKTQLYIPKLEHSEFQVQNPALKKLEEELQSISLEHRTYHNKNLFDLMQPQLEYHAFACNSRSFDQSAYCSESYTEIDKLDESWITMWQELCKNESNC